MIIIESVLVSFIFQRAEIARNNVNIAIATDEISEGSTLPCEEVYSFLFFANVYEYVFN